MKLTDSLEPMGQAIIWDYYNPRRIHTWNMLLLSYKAVDQLRHKEEIDPDFPFEVEYNWENYILRLWLYRTTIATLEKIPQIKVKAAKILTQFDEAFCVDGKNALKALRDMFVHFDDYAADKGRGPIERHTDLDQFREAGPDQFNRGSFYVRLKTSFDAAQSLRKDAQSLSTEFITWWNSVKN